MEWNKAKNIIILFLLLVNILLGGFMYNNSMKYVLTQSQKDNIMAVLKKNNISVKPKLIENYEPMRKLELSKVALDDKDMIDIFFNDPTGIVNTGSIEAPIYATEKEILQLGQVAVYYSNLNLDEANGAEEAKALCDKFISQMDEQGKGFIIDIIIEEDGYWTFEYRQIVGNYILYNNSIIFEVDNNGIRRVEYSINTPVGYQEGAREINSIDESLFTFSAFIADNLEYDTIVIDKIDIVYLNEESQEDTVFAVPAYRMWYSIYNENETVQRYCIINAYTSKIEPV